MKRIGRIAAVLGVVALLAVSWWYGSRVSERYKETILLAYSEARDDVDALIDRAKSFLEEELDLRVASEK